MLQFIIPLVAGCMDVDSFFTFALSPPRWSSVVAGQSLGLKQHGVYSQLPQGCSIADFCSPSPYSQGAMLGPQVPKVGKKLCPQMPDDSSAFSFQGVRSGTGRGERLNVIHLAQGHHGHVNIGLLTTTVMISTIFNVYSSDDGVIINIKHNLDAWIVHVG